MPMHLAKCRKITGDFRTRYCTRFGRIVLLSLATSCCLLLQRGLGPDESKATDEAKATAPIGLCFAAIGDTGGLPKPPYRTENQREVANLLGKVLERSRCKFVLGLGDNFYYKGVYSADDPRFRTSFEDVYAARALQVPWYMLAGNHDHDGNVSAQIAYSKLSRRWHFPDFFYSKTYYVPGTSTLVELIMIDTTILCDQRRVKKAPSRRKQLSWIEHKLNHSRADFLLVMGHHPVFSAGEHGSNRCLQGALKPLLNKYDVSAYLSGHEHNLQHIVEPGSDVSYLVSGSGTFVNPLLSNREKLPSGGLRFFNGGRGGFILVHVTESNMSATFISTGPKTPGYQVNLKRRLTESQARHVRKKKTTGSPVFDKARNISSSSVPVPPLNAAQAGLHVVKKETQVDKASPFQNRTASGQNNTSSTQSARDVEVDLPPGTVRNDTSSDAEEPFGGVPIVLVQLSPLQKLIEFFRSMQTTQT